MKWIHLKYLVNSIKTALVSIISLFYMVVNLLSDSVAVQTKALSKMFHLSWKTLTR